MFHAAYSQCGVFDHVQETRTGGVPGAPWGGVEVRGTPGPGRSVLGVGPRPPPAAPASPRASRRLRLTSSQTHRPGAMKVARSSLGFLALGVVEEDRRVARPEENICGASSSPTDSTIRARSVRSRAGGPGTLG